MTGRLQPYLPELTIRDYNTYLRYARGVRHQLHQEYGLVSCLSLRHHGVVCALLADSLAGRPATCREVRVPGTPWRWPIMCQTQGIRTAAQIEVLMEWHRLHDRSRSELPFKRRVRRLFNELLLRRAYEKAARENPSMERMFCQQRAQAIAQMNLRGQSYAVASEPMSNIYGALYALLAPDDATQSKSMRYIGSCVGKAFYLLDKADRHAVDKKHDRYNVFLANGLSEEAARENARRQAMAAANDLARAYGMLDIKLNRSLLDNIMILGLRNAVDPLDDANEAVRWELP